MKWMPAWGEERISNMIATRPDWCISRQRVWGVPIIVFYCESCQRAAHRSQDSGSRRGAVRASTPPTSGTSASAAELMRPGRRLRASAAAREFRKETDILDVWFDSGSSHLAVLTPENGLPWPADMYLEGGDQYRGWFHSSLLVGVGLQGRRAVPRVRHQRLDARRQGRAMLEIARQRHRARRDHQAYGAEVLRLWAASVDFTEDVRLSETILTRLSEAYRKLRNTFRYALGNLSRFRSGDATPCPASELLEIDQWILLRAEDLVAHCRAWYDEFAFHKVYRAVYDFRHDRSERRSTSTSSRIALYTAAPRSHRRRSAQTALYRISYALVRLLAPLLTFTAEEVWGYLAKPAGSPEASI